MIANEAYISMLDMSKFPPLASDFQDHKIEITQEPNWGSNSICAAQSTYTTAANSLTFISAYKGTVNESVLDYSSSSADKLALIYAAAFLTTSAFVF